MYYNTKNNKRGGKRVEERLVLEYIGDEADKFMKKKINWIAATLGQFIGPVWFFFRKSYLLGFAFLVVTYIVGKIAAIINLDEASYIMFFIYLFTANKLYLWDVRRKVNKIMSSQYMSEEQLISTVRKKGGTSTVAAVIYVVAIIAFISIYFFTIYSAMLSLILR